MKSIRKKYRNEFILTEMSNSNSKPFYSKNNNIFDLSNKDNKKQFLDTFKLNKKKYNLSSSIKLDKYKKIQSNNKKQNKIIKTLNFNKVKNISKFKNNLELNFEPKKLKLINQTKENKNNFKKKQIKFFKTIKNKYKTSLNLKIYESVKLKNKLKNQIINEDYNNFFKTLDKNEILEDNNSENNKNLSMKDIKIKFSEMFRLIFKKKEIEELLEFENSVLYKDENFKKLDLIFEKMKSKEKLMDLQNKIKNSISKYKLLKLKKSFIFKDIYYKNIKNWENILKKILNYCLLDKFKPKIERESQANINLTKTLNSIKFIKKVKRSKLKKNKNKIIRVFNKENKILNGVYISSWLNIIENFCNTFDYELNVEIGYYKIKGLAYKNNNKIKSLNTLKTKKKDDLSWLNNFIWKIEEDLNLDHKYFRIN